MPTPSEQKALAFVAIVIVLGGAVRVLRASSPPVATQAEQQAIARQATAAESASASAKSAKNGKKAPKMARQRRDGGVNIVGGVSGVPFSDVRPGIPAPSGAIGVSPLGYPPPSARIDIDNRQQPNSTVPNYLAAGKKPGGSPSAASPPLDLDTATEAEIEALPRIGPTLAARILASRDSLGPFSSLEGLRRVRGIGPAMLKTLGPRVTFSGRPASSGVRSRY
jgi:competence protein ComEA